MKANHQKTQTFRPHFPKTYQLSIDSFSDTNNIDHLRTEHQTLITERLRLSKVEQLKSLENKNKDEEINALNDKLHKLMIKSYDLDLAIEKEKDIRNKCDLEKIRIANYCNDIKNKFANVDKTIRTYEETINDMKMENERLANEYDSKIEEMEKTNNKIVKRIDNRIDVFNAQKDEIIEWENKVTQVKEEIEKQKNDFSEKMMVHKIRYDELEKKYTQLQKKIYDIQIDFEIKKAESSGVFKKQTEKVNEKDTYERTLTQLNIDNQSLENQIEEMNSQWKQLTVIDFEGNDNKKRKKKGISAVLDSVTSLNTLMKSRTKKINTKKPVYK